MADRWPHVDADRQILPYGWQRDSHLRASVDARVLATLYGGASVLETARVTGVSSRTVARIRDRARQADR